MRTAQSRFREIYKTPGVSNIQFAYNRPGIYLIKNKRTGKIDYIGHSKTNVAKTALRHFQVWNDQSYLSSLFPRHIVFKKPDNFLIRIIIFPNTATGKSQTARLEKVLIRLKNPELNPENYFNFKPTAKDMQEADDILTGRIFTESELNDLPF